MIVNRRIFIGYFPIGASSSSGHIIIRTVNTLFTCLPLARYFRAEAFAPFRCCVILHAPAECIVGHFAGVVTELGLLPRSFTNRAVA